LCDNFFVSCRPNYTRGSATAEGPLVSDTGDYLSTEFVNSLTDAPFLTGLIFAFTKHKEPWTWNPG